MPTNRQSSREQSLNSNTEATLILCGSSGERANINKARLYFKSRVSMLPFAGNYPNYLKYQKSNWLCQCTLSKEEERHLLSGHCPVYGDLCEGRHLTKDEDLVGLFTEILGRRERLEDNS